MGETKMTASQEVHVEIRRTYRVCIHDDGRTIWGESLAEELIEEALRLLCAEQRQDVNKAYEKLTSLAHQTAFLLLQERAAGKKPGLVVVLANGG
ncbi:MAG: hypothetical protein WC807_19585 [Hyphomicrobium sp.]|jgi:hypothetical protein